VSSARTSVTASGGTESAYLSYIATASMVMGELLEGVNETELRATWESGKRILGRSCL
jgi:hypothetical protein